METLNLKKEDFEDISENAFLLSGLNELNKLLNAHKEELTPEGLDKANFFVEKVLDRLSIALKLSVDSVL